ncbi:MAG: DUF2935 domain-containing protein [Actinobacteria bacterium]|nr:DUF2935 domain-containing protein [Actinomycetota bacterium]
MDSPSGMRVYTRGETGELEKPFEKAVILPQQSDEDPAKHAWADARFAADIMAEHGVFFALLMPPEAAPEERSQALRFSEGFVALYERIDSSGPPERTDLKSFTRQVIEEMKPFIEWKATQGDAQRSGNLRSLVWPLFFDHTRHEAERHTRRLEQLGQGDSGFDKKEVMGFWNNIMEEHGRFVAHLLDPDEFELIDEATKASNAFRNLGTGGVGGALSALAAEPGTVTKALTEFPETSAVLSAAELILDFKTKAARDIEAARIKSIIDPRLADHVRREALKFVDELRRAV